MPYYRHGDANAVCDRCGFEYKHSQTRREWTGLRVCSGPGTNLCWEERHPQEFVRGIKEKIAVFDPRPEPADVFVFAPYRREDETIILRENGLPLLRE